MRCDEFMVEMNRLLDERCGTLSDELRRHARNCRGCLAAWDTLRSCEQTLRDLDDSDTERVIPPQRERHTRERRNRKLAVAASFAATIALAMVTLAFAFSRANKEVGATVGSVVNNNDANTTQDWSQWTAAIELLDRDEFWNLRWSNDKTDASVAASVSSGIRPVAQTMSSALKVIRRNVLPTTRQSDVVDEQAVCFRPVSLV